MFLRQKQGKHAIALRLFAICRLLISSLHIKVYAMGKNLNQSVTTEKIVIPLTALKADPRNPRKVSGEALAGLAISLETFGPLDIAFNDRTGELVSGHQRIRSLREAGAVECVRDGDAGYVAHPKTGERFPIRFVDWDETKQRMANLVANNPHLQGEFDGQALDQLRALESEIGFAEMGLEKLAKELEGELPEPEPTEGECDPDDVPDEPVTPLSKRGDIWILGDHRLMCGDSTSEEDVGRLMGGANADLLLTDPPYGVSYVGKTKDAMTIQNDDLSPEELGDMMKNVFDVAEKFSRPGAYWYATVPAGPLHVVFLTDWLKRGILRQILVWVKDVMVLGYSEYHYKHEPILFGWVQGGDRYKNDDRTRTSVWDVPRPKVNKEHPTMKPVDLWIMAIKDGSRVGDSVIDQFSGSGTTIIACEQTKRRAFAMELEPKYVDVAVARWEKFTGKTAYREDADAR